MDGDCTSEGCDAKTGQCTAPTLAGSGQLCNADANGCTVGDVCNKAGACVAGGTVICSQPQDSCLSTVCQGQPGGVGYVCAPIAVADGKPCDDGATCTLGAVCKGGACTMGLVSILFARYLGPATGQQALQAVFAHSDGTITAGGWKAGANATRRPWMVHTDELGNVDAESTSPSDQASNAVGVAGVFEIEDDGVLAVGTEVDATGLIATVARTFGPGLKLTKTTVIRHQSGHEERVIGTRRYAKDKITVAIQPHDPKTPSTALLPYKVRITNAAALTSTWHQLAPTTAFAAVAVDVKSPFDWFFGAGPSWVLIGQIGELVAEGGFGGVDKLLGIGRMTPTVGTTTSILMSSGQAPNISLQLAFIDAQKFNPYKLRDVDKGFIVRDSVVVEERIFAVGERAGVAEILVVDLAGNVVRSAPLQVPTAGGSHALVATTGATLGGIWAVGSQLMPDGVRRALLVRSNAFGHTSCKAAGACAELKGRDCNDKSSCSVDVCDAKFGCLSNAGAPYCTVDGGCTPIGSCTTDGCIEAGPSRFWANVHTLPAAGNGFAAFLGLGSGGMLFSASDARVYNLDIAGTGSAQGPPTNEDKLCTAIAKTTDLLPDPLDPKPAMQWLGRDSKGSAVFCIRRVTTLAAAPLLQVSLTTPCVGCVVTPRLVVRQIDGGHVLLTDVQGSGSGTLLTRLNALVKPIWTLHHVQPGLSLATRDFAQLATLDGFVVGSAGPSANALDRGFALRVSEGGKALSFKTYTSHAGRALVGAKAVSPTIVVAGGTVQINNTIRSPWLLGLDDKGETAFEWIAPAKDPPATLESIASVDGVIYWAGASLVSASQGFSVGGHNANGQPLWRRNSPMALTRVLPHSLHSVSGDLIAAATASPLGASVGSVVAMRMSAWGHLSCSDAVGCGAPGQVCDDANPCTADICVAGSGCSAVKLTGVACAEGKVCAEGVCK